MISIKPRDFKRAFPLSGIISIMTREEIRSALLLLGFRAKSTLRKDELVSALTDLLLNNTGYILRNLPYYEMDIIRELAETYPASIIRRPKPIDAQLIVLETGFLAFNDPDDLSSSREYMVCDEVWSSVLSVIAEVEQDRKQRQMDTFEKAMVSILNVHGKLPYSDVVCLAEQVTGLSADEVYTEDAPGFLPGILCRISERGDASEDSYPICCPVSSYEYDTNLEIAPPQVIPPIGRDVYECFCPFPYIQPSSGIAAELRSLLKDLYCSSDPEADMLFHKVWACIQTGSDMGFSMPGSEKDADRLLQLIGEFSDSCPLWVLHGFSKKEIGG